MHPLTRALAAGLLAASLAVPAVSHAATPKPKAKPTVLVVFNGSYAKTSAANIFDDSESKHFVYRGTITVTVVGTQINPKYNAAAYFNVSADVVTAINEVGQIAIAPGDPKSQTIRATFSAADNKCKFGCVVSAYQAQNIKWHVVVTKG